MVVLSVTCATRMVQYYSFSPWTFEDLAQPLSWVFSPFFFFSCLMFRLVLSTCGSLSFFFFFFLTRDVRH